MNRTKEFIRSILLKSERFIKTDSLYLAKGAFWLAFGQVISNISAFILAVAFAHILPKEVFGQYNYVLAVAAIIGSISLSGLNTSIVRSTARGFEGELEAGFKKNLRWSVPLTLISFAISFYYLLNENLTLSMSFAFMGIFLPILNSSSLYSSYLVGVKQFKEKSIYSIPRIFLPMISILVTVLFTHNVVLIVLSYFLSNALVTLFLYYKTKKNFTTNSLIDNDSKNFGEHVSLMNFFNAVVSKIDSVLIFHFLGASQLAIYAFAINVPQQAVGALKNISLLAAPKFATQDKAELKKTIFARLKLFFFVMLAAFALYWFIAPVLFQYAFPQYHESIRYSQVYALILVFAGTIIGTFFDSQKEVKLKYINNITTNIIRLFSICFLGYLFGIWGIIAANIFSRAFTFFLSIILVKYS